METAVRTIKMSLPFPGWVLTNVTVPPLGVVVVVCCKVESSGGYWGDCCCDWPCCCPCCGCCDPPLFVDCEGWWSRLVIIGTGVGPEDAILVFGAECESSFGARRAGGIVGNSLFLFLDMLYDVGFQICWYLFRIEIKCFVEIVVCFRLLCQGEAREILRKIGGLWWKVPGKFEIKNRNSLVWKKTPHYL